MKQILEEIQDHNSTKFYNKLDLRMTFRQPKKLSPSMKFYICYDLFLGMKFGETEDILDCHTINKIQFINKTQKKIKYQNNKLVNVKDYDKVRAVIRRISSSEDRVGPRTTMKKVRLEIDE